MAAYMLRVLFSFCGKPELKKLGKSHFSEDDTPDKSSQDPSRHPGYSHAGLGSIAPASLHHLIDMDEA